MLLTCALVLKRQSSLRAMHRTQLVAPGVTTHFNLLLRHPRQAWNANGRVAIRRVEKPKVQKRRRYSKGERVLFVSKPRGK